MRSGELPVSLTVQLPESNSLAVANVTKIGETSVDQSNVGHPFCFLLYLCSLFLNFPLVLLGFLDEVLGRWNLEAIFVFIELLS